MITGLAHLCYRVADIEASIAFYRDKLGLPVAFDFKNDRGVRTGAYLHVGGRNFVELFQCPADAQTPADTGRGYAHMCLEVDDLAATAELLRTRGVEVTEVKMGLDHSWQAWLSDPDGQRIELHQYTPESWQAPSLR